MRSGSLWAGPLGLSFLWSFGTMMVFFFLNFHLEALGFSRHAIGTAQAILSGTGVVFALPLSWVIPRVGYRFSLRLAMGLALGGLFLVGTGYGVFGGLILYGTGGLLFQGALVPLLARLSSRNTRVQLFSIQAALTTLSGFLANLMAGALSRWVAPTQVLFGALPFFLLTGLIPLPDAPPPVSSPPRLRIPPVWFRLVLPQILIGFGAGLVIPFLNLFLREKFQLSYAQVSWMFAVSSLATALAMLLQPPLVRRLGKIRAMVFMQGLSLPFLAALAWSSWIPLVTVSLLVRGALMNAAWPVYNALAMDLLSEGERPGFLLLQNALWSLTWAGASALSGSVQDQLGPHAFDALFAATLILYAGGTALYPVLLREPLRRVQEGSGFRARRFR